MEDNHLALLSIVLSLFAVVGHPTAGSAREATAVGIGVTNLVGKV